jgi:hypothetical protein
MRKDLSVEQTIAVSNAQNRIARAVESLERTLNLDDQMRSSLEHEAVHLARASHQFLTRSETPSHSSAGTFKSLSSQNGKTKQILRDLHQDLMNLTDVLLQIQVRLTIIRIRIPSK